MTKHQTNTTTTPTQELAADAKATAECACHYMDRVELEVASGRYGPALAWLSQHRTALAVLQANLQQLVED